MTSLSEWKVKRHGYPIRREAAVQVLQAKVESVGAHKDVIVSTAPLQRGALNHTLVHGIAVVKVKEGRFTIETRGVAPPSALLRQQAAELGILTLVGHCCGRGTESGSVGVTVVTERPGNAARLLLGLDEPPHGNLP